MLRGWRCAAPLLALCLTACGGGGGGGGGSNAPPVQRLELNTTQLTFAAFATANAPPPQILSGTVTGNPAAVYAMVEITTSGIDAYSTPQISGDAVSTLITVRPPFTLPQGTYRDTVTVRACPNPACTTQFLGSPVTVNVTYVVGLDSSPASLSATAIEGAAPPPQTVDLRYYAGNGTWTTSVAYAAGSGWLTVPASGSTLPATFAASFMPELAGDYLATLRVTASGAVAQTRDVPVAYTVQPLLQVPAIAELDVTNEQPASDAVQVRSVVVAAADPARNTAWTASADSNAKWLRLDSASGTTGAASTLAVSLVSAEVAKLDNGRYVATVSVDPADANASTVAVPVVLDLDRTHVATVAPYVAADSVEGDVVIRGTRFDDVTIADVRFGGLSAVGGFELDGATRVRARHPALAPGRYPVTLVTVGPAVDSSAELVVVARVPYSAAGSVAAPVPFASIAEFDPERRACYVASAEDPGAARIGAVIAGAASWTTLLSAGAYGPFIRGMALTAGGRELLIALNEEIVHLDPVTLVETGRTTVSAASSPNNTIAGLARVDDGTVAFGLAGEIRAYRPWNRNDEHLAPLNIVGGIDAIETGNKLLWVSGFGNTSYLVIDSFDLSTSFAFDDDEFNLMIAAADRFGDRWAFTSPTNTFVIDAQGAELGVIPMSGNATSSALSADGRKLALGFFGEYRFFDLTPVASGGAAIDLGSAPPAAPNTLYNLHFTPHQDEVVSCGRGIIQGTAVP